MGKVEKYLNIAKTAVIKTPKDIDGKILKKLESIKEDDKLLLDENFLEYLRKNNSRIYLFNEKIKNNQGQVIISSIVFFTVFFFVIYKLLSSKKKRN